MTTVNDTTDDTHTIESSELEDKLLDMMKHAAETGAGITVTGDGHPLLHLAATKPNPDSSCSGAEAGGNACGWPSDLG